MNRNQEIKQFLLDLKMHLKTTSGDVKEAAIAYLAPVKKKTTRKKASNAR